MMDQNPTREPTCKICGAYYSAHTAGPCEWCRLPIEHHSLQGGRSDTTAGSPAGCKAEKARMARARRAAGSELTDVDQRALAGAQR